MKRATKSIKKNLVGYQSHQADCGQATEYLWCQNALLKNFTSIIKTTATICIVSLLTVTYVTQKIDCSPQNGLPASIMSHLASGSGK